MGPGLAGTTASFPSLPPGYHVPKTTSRSKRHELAVIKAGPALQASRWRERALRKYSGRKAHADYRRGDHRRRNRKTRLGRRALQFADGRDPPGAGRKPRHLLP